MVQTEFYIVFVCTKEGYLGIEITWYNTDRTHQYFVEIFIVLFDIYYFNNHQH